MRYIYRAWDKLCQSALSWSRLSGSKKQLANVFANCQLPFANSQKCINLSRLQYNLI